MKKLLRAGAYSYLATGFSHVLIGSILTALLAHYGGQYTEGGRLVFAQFLGFMFGVSLVGPFVQRLGRRNVLACAMLVLAAAQVYASTLPAWEALTALMFLMGIAFGSIESTVGALILLAFREKQASAMGKLELYFGLGALLMPFFSGIFLYFGIWRYSFLPLGLVALALAVVWLRTDFGTEAAHYLNPVTGTRDAGEDKAERTAAEERKAGRSYMVLGVFAVFFFLYVGSEVCLIEFTPSWMRDRYGVFPSASAWSITLYWLTMSIGRMFIGTLAERFGYWSYLLVCAGGTVTGLAGLAYSGVAWLAYLFMAVLGFAMAGIFAVALIYANSMLKGREQATASVLISMGGVGGAVMPLVLGRWMDRFGSFASIMLLGTAAVLMLVIALAAPLLKGPHPKLRQHRHLQPEPHPQGKAMDSAE